MAGFGEPQDWTDERDQRMESDYPELADTSADDLLGVDTYAINRGGSATKFSSNAMGLGAHSAAVQQEDPSIWGKVKSAGSSLLSNVINPILALDTPLSQRAGYVTSEDAGITEQIAGFTRDELTRPSNIALAIAGIFTGGLSTGGALTAGGTRIATRTAAAKIARSMGQNVLSGVGGQLAAKGVAEVAEYAPDEIGPLAGIASAAAGAYATRGRSMPVRGLATVGAGLGGYASPELAGGLAGGVLAYKGMNKLSSWKEAITDIESRTNALDDAVTQSASEVLKARVTAEADDAAEIARRAANVAEKPPISYRDLDASHEMADDPAGYFGAESMAQRGILERDPGAAFKTGGDGFDEPKRVRPPRSETAKIVRYTNFIEDIATRVRLWLQEFGQNNNTTMGPEFAIQSLGRGSKESVIEIGDLLQDYYSLAKERSDGIQKQKTRVNVRANEVGKQARADAENTVTGSKLQKKKTLDKIESDAYDESVKYSETPDAVEDIFTEQQYDDMFDVLAAAHAVDVFGLYDIRNGLRALRSMQSGAVVYRSHLKIIRTLFGKYIVGEDPNKAPWIFRAGTRVANGERVTGTDSVTGQKIGITRSAAIDEFGNLEGESTEFFGAHPIKGLSRRLAKRQKAGESKLTAAELRDEELAAIQAKFDAYNATPEANQIRATILANIPRGAGGSGELDDVLNAAGIRNPNELQYQAAEKLLRERMGLPPSGASAAQDAVSGTPTLADYGLDSSTPKYGARKMVFADEIDKAYYIVAKRGKLSDGDSKFMDYLRDVTGLDDASILASAKTRRAEIIEIAKTSKGDVNVPSSRPVAAADAAPATPSASAYSEEPRMQLVSKFINSDDIPPVAELQAQIDAIDATLTRDKKYNIPTQSKSNISKQKEMGELRAKIRISNAVNRNGSDLIEAIGDLDNDRNLLSQEADLRRDPGLMRVVRDANYKQGKTRAGRASAATSGDTISKTFAMSNGESPHLIDGEVAALDKFLEDAVQEVVDTPTAPRVQPVAAPEVAPAAAAAADAAPAPAAERVAAAAVEAPTATVSRTGTRDVEGVEWERIGPPQKGRLDQETLYRYRNRFSGAVMEHTPVPPLRTRLSESIPDAAGGSKPPGRTRRTAAGGGKPPSDTPGAQSAPSGDLEPIPEFRPVPEPKPWYDHLFWDLLSVPRSLKSAFDLSAAGRQGLIPSLRHPGVAGKAFKAQWKAMRSEQGYLDHKEGLLNKPHADARDIAEIDVVSQFDNPIRSGEKRIVQQGLDKIFGYRGSARAYDAYLSELRDGLFEVMIRNSRSKKGELIDYTDAATLALPETQKTLRQFGRLINLSTGRLDVSDFLKSQQVQTLGSKLPMMWAPQLLLSRAALPFELFSSNKQVRAEIIQELALFVGVNAALLGAMNQFGIADVQLDPRSADFLQARIGATRIDPWAGYRPIANLVARMQSGQQKSTATDDVYTSDRKDIVAKFLQTKLEPVSATALSFYIGEDMAGKTPEFRLKTAADLLAPLFLAEMYESYQIGGAKSAALTVPSVVGIGAGTYESSIEKMKRVGLENMDTSERVQVIPALAFRELYAGADPVDRLAMGGFGSMAAYLVSIKEKRIEELASGKSGYMPLSPDAAVFQAEAEMQRLPSNVIFAKIKNELENKLIVERPADAREYIAKEADKAPLDRRFGPTKPQQNYINQNYTPVRQ